MLKIKIMDVNVHENLERLPVQSIQTEKVREDLDFFIAEDEAMNISEIVTRNNRIDIRIEFKIKEERNKRMIEYIRELNNGLAYDAFVTEVTDYEGEDFIKPGEEEYGFTLSLDDTVYSVLVLRE